MTVAGSGNIGARRGSSGEGGNTLKKFATRKLLIGYYVDLRDVTCDCTLRTGYRLSVLFTISTIVKYTCSKTSLIYTYIHMLV